MQENNFETYLDPGFYINSDHPEIIEFTKTNTDNFHSIREKIEVLYCMSSNNWE